MTKDEIEKEVERLSPWYHAIALPFGITTQPLWDIRPVWDNIRSARSKIDYVGKKVLDIAAFDGMWSFEAEDLGAELVISTDCNWIALQHFLMCKQARNSKAIPFYNVPPHDLYNRLDSYLKGRDCKWAPSCDVGGGDTRFDVVHHLGLFYHLVDPVQSLLQARSVMREGGSLLFETAYSMSDKNQSHMVFNGRNDDGTYRIYPDTTTWWAPTLKCIEEILLACLFKPVFHCEITGDTCGRTCFVAEAIPFSEKHHGSEILNSFRTPGYSNRSDLAAANLAIAFDTWRAADKMLGQQKAYEGFKYDSEGILSLLK